MATQEPQVTTNPARILVVDDHPNTAHMLARALSLIGPNVIVISATSGREALEKTEATGVDILFTDMVMPEMSGMELIEKLRVRPVGSPAYIYLITAYDVPDLRVTAQRLGIKEVLIKPVHPERVSQIAVQALEEMKHSHLPR